MALAVPELIWFAILFFSFAVVYTLRKFIEGLFSPLISALGHLPGIGGLLSGVLRSIEQSVSHALGAAEAGIDSAIGASFHELARLTEWLWREFKAHSLLFAVAATIIGELVHGYRRLTHAVHDVTRSLTHTLHRVEAQERRLLHGIDRLQRDITRVEHGIGHDVLPRIRSLDREIAHIEDRAIPDIRSIAQAAEGDVTALRKWITANIPLIGTTALVGAVAWALAQLGLGGLRCPSFGRLLSKWGCGLGGLLDALLGLAISALALENVCTLLPIAETAFGDVVGPVTHLLTEVPLGGCETPPKGWPTLSVATGPLPPPQTLGTLAA